MLEQDTRLASLLRCQVLNCEKHVSERKSFAAISDAS